MIPTIKKRKEFESWKAVREFLSESSSHFVWSETYPENGFQDELKTRVIMAGPSKEAGHYHLPLDAPFEQVEDLCRMLCKSAQKAIDLPSFLQDFAGQLGETENQQEMAHHILLKVTQLYSSEGAAIILLDEDRQLLRFTYTFSHIEGMDQRLQGMEAPADTGIAGWVITNRRAQLVRDVSQDNRFNKGIDEKAGSETRELMLAPIILGEKVLGVLEVVNSMGRAFIESDLESLSVVAAVVAIFMEKAQLSMIERRAERAEGRAEIASSVLHNIGNVINSLNVACAMMESTLEKSRVQKLDMALQLMKDNQDNLGAFFGEDPKGKMLPEFLFRVGEQLENERNASLAEVRKITSKAQLMQDIIETQQLLSKMGSTEAHDLIQLVEEALTVQHNNLKKHSVTVIKDFHTDKPVRGMKPKIVHILINLIKNGVEAMRDKPESERALEVRLSEEDGSKVRLDIIDSGCGITPDVLKQLFTHGFTTKADGHGFGLAACAQDMKEMGGDIRAQSDGQGLGATFSLTFPTMK